MWGSTRGGAISTQGWFFLLLFISLPAVGQELSPAPLKLDKLIPVPAVPGGAILNPIKCDGRGNIYVRMDHPRAFATPVLKIAPDGEKKAVFSTESIEGWEDAEVYDFAPQLDGDLYLLAARPGKSRSIEHAVLSFSDQGKFRYAIVLKYDFTSTDQLAVFSTGEFLVAGWKKPASSESRKASTAGSSAGKEPDVEPQTVVFDRNGSVIRKVQLSMDLPTGREAGAARSPLLLPASAISLGSSTAGDLGELFIMFRGSTPTIFIIPPRGSAVTKIEISPPTENAIALGLGYASGLGLVIQFAEKTNRDTFNTARSIISIVDPQTGERLYDYQSTQEVGGAFACRSSAGFLFLVTQKDGLLAIRRAVPR